MLSWQKRRQTRGASCVDALGLVPHEAGDVALDGDAVDAEARLKREVRVSSVSGGCAVPRRRSKQLVCSALPPA